jgi:hypothetical protein
MQPHPLRGNHIKHAIWAIDLVQTDLTKLSEGDWLNLKQQFFDFLTAEIEWSFGLNVKALHNEDVVKLGQLIGVANTKLDAIMRDRIHKYVADEKDQEKALALDAQNRKKWNRLLTPEDANRFQTNLREMLHWLRTEKYDHLIDFEFVPVDDWLSEIACARLQLYLVASGIDKSQLRECPECKRLFLKQTRPEANKTYYCTHRCAQVVASRAYRERNQSVLRPTERERKRRSYVEKQRRIYGPNVRVQRRPRG